MKNKKVLRLIASLSACTIAAITVTNKVIYHLAVSKKLLEKETGEYYDWRFGKIYYKKEGSGSPLLLVHTLDAAASSYEWKELIHILSKNYTVYTLDLIGCGKSDKPKITYTNYLYVQLISDFIKNVIGRKTDVIASGISASFITMACNIDATLFHKIMMINPDTFQELYQTPKGTAKLIKRLIDLPLIGTLLFNILYSRKHIDTRLTESYFSSSFISTTIPDVYLESSHINGIGGKYLTSSIKGRYINIQITNALHAIDNSIYLVIGDENPDKEAILSDYCECNPAIETCIIPHSKKYTQLECPEELIRQIEIFF